MILTIKYLAGMFVIFLAIGKSKFYILKDLCGGKGA